jgi:hypothetical protein
MPSSSGPLIRPWQRGTASGVRRHLRRRRAGGTARERVDVELCPAAARMPSDRQVEAARLRRQIGRREALTVASLLGGNSSPLVYSAARALARSLDLGVGAADRREARQALARAPRR